MDIYKDEISPEHPLQAASSVKVKQENSVYNSPDEVLRRRRSLQHCLGRPGRPRSMGRDDSSTSGNYILPAAD